MTGAKVCSKLEGYSRLFPNLTFYSRLLRFQLFTLQTYKSVRTQNKNGKNDYGNFYGFLFIRFCSISVLISKT